MNNFLFAIGIEGFDITGDIQGLDTFAIHRIKNVDGSTTEN